MRTFPVAMIGLLALTAGVAMDASALSRACITSPLTTVGTTSFALVTGTSGFVFPTACPTSGGPYHLATVAPCPAPVGPQPGQYCGPVIGPFSKAVCTWFPVVNSFPTGLYAGFDYTGDGNVFFPSGEHVEGPIPQFPLAGVINNPTPFPGRIIAYPTNLVSQASAAGDLNLVMCT